MEVERIEAPLGAWVRGLDVAAISEHDGAVLRAALWQHAVLVVRDQGIEERDVAALGRVFGDVEVSEDDEPAGWHSSGSYRMAPPVCTLALAVEVPTRGGQSQFADMRKMFALLPPDQRAEIAGLSLVHRYGQAPPVEHPWVRTHADSSPSLFMGAYASHIVGRGERESRQWFAEIEAQLSVLDVVYEHRWLPGDLLIWDNRTTLHRALPYDTTTDRRIMHHLTTSER